MRGFAAGDEHHPSATTLEPWLHALFQLCQDLVDGGLVGPFRSWIVLLVPGVGGIAAVGADPASLEQAAVQIAAVHPDPHGPGAQPGALTLSGAAEGAFAAGQAQDRSGGRRTGWRRGAVAVTALTAASPLAATPPASWGVSATNTCITPGIWSSPMSAPPGSQPAARRLDSGPAPHSATVVQFVADEGLGGLQRAAGRAGRRRINLDADLVPVTVLAAALVAIGQTVQAMGGRNRSGWATNPQAREPASGQASTTVTSSTSWANGRSARASWSPR